MSVFQQLIAGLPAVAASWQAMAGYLALVVAFIVVSLKVTRNKNLLNKLKSLPEKDRARVLQMEMGSAYLATGLSPEHWLQQQRQRFYFVGFLAVCGLSLTLALAAIWSGPTDDPLVARHRAERVALDFVAKLHAADVSPAYDLFPDEVKKNIGFAQFQAETHRLLFQLPGAPLRSSVEQTVDNGAMLSVLVTSEFSVGTRVRNIVGFAKAADGWKLWNYNWQPLEWPLVWPSSTETHASASEAMRAYRLLPEVERQSPLPDRFRGTITGSAPGWKVSVQSVRQEHDKSRCSVAAVDAQSSTPVQLKHVVGGCKLREGDRILVNALLLGIDDTHIELDGVRFYPDNRPT